MATVRGSDTAPLNAGRGKWNSDGVHAYHLNLCHLRTADDEQIKLFGTTIQENINNSMWNYGAALSLIMLFLIGASTLIAGDGSKQEGGIR